MKNVMIKHPKTGALVTLVDSNEHITFISDRDIDWSDNAVCNHLNTAKNHDAPYGFHIEGFRSRVAFISWTLYPDGRFFEDEDGFGGENCNDETVYAYIDENLNVVIPFQTMDGEKKQEFFCQAVNIAESLSKE